MSQEAKKLKGIKICRGAPAVTHLFFANDSLLFFKTSRSSTAKIKGILETYEIISGQKINYGKSEIRFSCNMGIQDKTLFSNILDVKTVDSHDRYLGMPFVSVLNKSEAFKSLIDKIQ